MPKESDFGYRGFDMAPEASLTPLSAATRWFQHLVVLELRREMAATAASKSDVASALRVVDGQLRKKLAGTSGLTLDDLVALTLAFGPKLMPSFATELEMFPPGLRGSLEMGRNLGMTTVSLVT